MKDFCVLLHSEFVLIGYKWANSFSHHLKIRQQQYANDGGYEAHTRQAWALVVFSNVRVEGSYPRDGVLMYEGARAFIFKRRFVEAFKVKTKYS